MAAGSWQLQSCTNDAKYLCLEIFTAKPNGKRYLAALSGCNPLKNILRGGGGYPRLTSVVVLQTRRETIPLTSWS